MITPLRAFLGAVLTGGALALLMLTPSVAGAKNCGDKYGQLTDGGPGVLILQHRDVNCATVKTIGNALLKGTIKLPSHVDGLYCRIDPKIQAGGGAALCTRGSHLILYGFE